MKWKPLVRANSDKPHRCPCCHAVSVGDHPYAYRWRIYSCGTCGVRWWRGWSGEQATCIHHRLKVDLLFLADDAREQGFPEVGAWLTARMIKESDAVEKRTSNTPPGGGYAREATTNG